MSVINKTMKTFNVPDGNNTKCYEIVDDKGRKCIAKDWASNSSSAFAVGEYVIKDGVCYKFTSAHTAGSAWSASEVVETNLGSEITRLKSATNSIESLIESSFAIEKIDKNTTDVLSGYITYNDTESATKVMSSANYKTIYQKALNGANMLILTGSNTASSFYGEPALVFYDSSKVMLNSGLVEWSASTVFDSTYVEVPEGAAYFSFDGRITDDLAFSASMYYRYKDKIDDLYGEVAKCANNVFKIHDLSSDYVVNQYMSYSTTTNRVKYDNSANYRTLKFVPIGNKDKYVIVNGQSGINNQTTVLIAFYGEDISSTQPETISYESQTRIVTYTNEKIAIPAGTKYVSVTFRAVSTDSNILITSEINERVYALEGDIETLSDEKITRFGTVAEMKADVTLEDGMCAITCGYASVNDGGGALYRISASASGVYETLDNGLYAIANIDESSVLNYAGETIEKKVQGFMETATEGKMLDLKGARINITERYVKSTFSRLQYMSISNGHFYIPYEIGGWLSIPSSAGNRPPVFINCTFSGGGSLFYDMSISFKAIGCIFKNVQIIRHGSYVQDIQLNGCNVTCLVPLDDNDGDDKILHAYFIDAELIIAGYFNNCSFESENRGLIHASSGAGRASLAAFTIQGCVIEGIPSYDIIESHGIRDLRVLDTYIEKVGYFIYDTIESNPEFRMSLINCHIDNRAVGTKYFIRTDATQPKLIATGNYYLQNDDQFLCNFDNNAHVIGDHNLFNGNRLYGFRVTEENPDGVAEYNTNHFLASGTLFSFKTLINAPEKPQAFLVIVQKTDAITNAIHQEVYLLTLEYDSTNGYSIISTPIKTSAAMTDSDRIAWTASATSYRDAVNVSGTSQNNVQISVTNLGSVFSGLSAPGISGTTPT